MSPASDVCVLCVWCTGAYHAGQCQLNVDHNSQWHDATPSLVRARRRWMWTTRGHLHQVRRYCKSTRVSREHSCHTVIYSSSVCLCRSCLCLMVTLNDVFSGNLQSSIPCERLYIVLTPVGQTHASWRQEFFRRRTVSLERSACRNVTEISHLYSSRDFWRHFGLCRAAGHSDCYFFQGSYYFAEFIFADFSRQNE